MKLTSDSEAPVGANSLLDAQSVPSHVNDLLKVGRIPPELSVAEDNIIVYIAGYLGRKASKKFQCKACQMIWQMSSSNADSHIFVNNKQYCVAGESGLYPQCCYGLSFVSQMEISFRSDVPLTMHSGKIRGRFVTKVTTNANLPVITCGQNVCDTARQYIIDLFFTVRIHHVLREENRSFECPGRKRNRKTMKFMHI